MSLESVSTERFFTCKKDKLSRSPYCLLCYIYILMNRREIYFLCENTTDFICLDYSKGKFCRHCRRLEKYNSLFEEIRKKKILVVNEKKNHSLKLVDLVNRSADHVLKYKKYYILPELTEKICNINH